VDVFQKCSEYIFSRQVREANLYPYYRNISSPQDPVVTLNGAKVVMLGSNNYLGLTNHPEVREASKAAIDKYGTGCAGSRLLNGTLDIHVELEEALRSFLGADAVLTFSTGFQVNLGVLSALLSRHDVALMDSLNHASLIDGVRLGFGKSYKYAHNDIAGLDAKLGRIPASRGKLVAVDGIFSMEGDIVDLPGIVKLREKHDFRIMVDDAHSVGVLGERGRGTAEHFGLEDQVDLTMGTFSKSLAAIGGYVAGSPIVIDYLKHHARAQIFSAAPPPASCGAVIKAIELIQREPERRKQLWENTCYMKGELESLGYDTMTSESPVIPMMIGDDLTTFSMAVRLQEEGVFANPIVAPAVASGQAMIRTSYMATHTREHLDRSLSALAKVGREFGVI